MDTLLIGIQSEISKIHALGLLPRLLEDKTTRGNIIWATDAYSRLGDSYHFQEYITPYCIVGENSGVIKNRAQKTLEQQSERVRDSAEVFTPLSVCRRMNDDMDAEWFGRSGAFDGERIDFSGIKGKDPWKRYVDARRLEIACGEAPYLVSRYDVITGEIIPIKMRAGILDRKLRAVGENTESEGDWLKWAFRAFQSVYGYEYQGDNLLIARVNLLLTFEEYMMLRWRRQPERKEWAKLANIIAWNIWQMDGTTSRVPLAASGGFQTSLFDIGGAEWDFLSYGPQDRIPFCRVYDWRRGSSREFVGAGKGKRKMRFDFIIGNPPYQDENNNDARNYAPPIYDRFLDASYEIADRVEMIHPARFLFNAGSTPKEWNKKMLKDPHLKVLMYEPDSSKIFSNTDIKGGVAITYRDKTKKFGAIEIFTVFKELNSIIEKTKSRDTQNLSNIILSRTSYHLTNKMHEEHPEAKNQLSKGHLYDMSSNIFNRLPQIFYDEKPDDGHKYIQILGRENNTRIYKYIREDYVNKPRSLDKFKVFATSANGTGSLGEELSTPLIVEPLIGHTETFISIGAFTTITEAEAVLKYIKTKFARVLLGVLKVTQNTPPAVWRMIPLQDFTSKSDIDWSASVAEIDRQLYAKYGLDEEEIGFIESHVREMD